MTFKPVSALSKSGLGAIGVAAAALFAPQAAGAQVAIETLPPEYQTGPAVADYSETVVDVDGVETITRTRRIERTTSLPADYAEYQVQGGPAYPVPYAYPNATAYGYAPAASIFSPEQWIAECEDRTNGRDDREKGGIIGGLLGAITGGIIGNRVADGDRLAGTLIGVGTGGIAGVLLGNLIGGGRNDRGDYDCEAALDSYLSQYGYPGAAPVARIASRSIPAPAYPAYAPPPAYGYGYGYAPSYSYSYAPPQQVVYVPIRYEQRQRVIVRETVREEMVPVERARLIPEQSPVEVEPAPASAAEPRYIKNN
ncbi:MAG: hypothetical protein AAF697_08650 [Pseudomonadota bacterium]